MSFVCKKEACDWHFYWRYPSIYFISVCVLLFVLFLVVDEGRSLLELEYMFDDDDIQLRYFSLLNTLIIFGPDMRKTLFYLPTILMKSFDNSWRGSKVECPNSTSSAGPARMCKTVMTSKQMLHSSRYLSVGIFPSPVDWSARCHF